MDAVDGYFNIDYKDGDAFITVFPAIGEGMQVLLGDVVNRLKILKVPPVPVERLQNIVERRDARETRLGSWPEGAYIRGKIMIKTESDGTAAYAQVIPGRMQERNFSSEDVLERLAAMGVTHGIRQDAIDAIFSEKNYHKDVLVAHGTLPKVGQAGRVEFLYPDEEVEFKEDEKGRVNYRDVNKIKSIRKNEVIARLLDPEPGRDGNTIFGAILPSKPGESTEILPGRNTILSEDRKELLAACDGYLAYAMNTVHVEDICKLPAVNFETGNITFNGTVMAGSVENGFHITAEGSIHIEEPLEKVYLTAAQHIYLCGGIRGKGLGLIEAGEEIKAKFAENANLISASKIEIVDGLLNCKVMVDQDLILTGDRGDIMGGRVIAGRHIDCNRMGTKSEAKTEIFLGIPPAVIKELNRLQVDFERNQEILQKVLHSLGPGGRVVDRAGLAGAPPDLDSERLSKLKLIQTRLETKLKDLTDQMESIMGSYEPVPGASIRIREMLFPNVKIYVGKLYKTIRGREIPGPLWVALHEGEIIIGHEQPGRKSLRKLEETNAPPQ